MSWKLITEPEFSAAIKAALSQYTDSQFDFVTGPGRSGAIAAVYASYILGIPFVPHKARKKQGSERVLIVDTAIYTGQTVRKAAAYYQKLGNTCEVVTIYKESKRDYVYFWYEGVKS